MSFNMIIGRYKQAAIINSREYELAGNFPLKVILVKVES